MDFVSRFFQSPEASHFLFGPRGTGKSTFLRQAFPDALWVDLLQPEVHQRFAACPERLRELVAGRPEAKVGERDLRGLRVSWRTTRRPRRGCCTGGMSGWRCGASAASRARPT